MPPDDAHAFAAPVLWSDTNASMRMHSVPLPMEVAEMLEAQGVRRLVGTLNGHPFRLALHGRRGGERYLLLSHDLLRTVGVQFGDTVVVDLQPDPEPDRVDLGEELDEALRQDAAAAARWATFTPGRQRSLAHYVTSAKRTETRVSRALELTHKLGTYTLYGDLHPEKR